MAVFADLREIEAELETLTHRMARLDPPSEEYRWVADRFHRLDSEFRARDGYTIEAKVGTVLERPRVPQEDWTRRTEEFSGGWQMRIALAKLLLEQPNLLLLDEPTNHLDLEARNWLEDYLANYPHRVRADLARPLFPRRDREKIVEIWNKRSISTPATTRSIWRRRRSARPSSKPRIEISRSESSSSKRSSTASAYQATKAKQVQSRIKELEKIERIEIPPEEKTIHFTLSAAEAERPDRRRVSERLEELRREAGVLRGVNFVIERGDRVALVGVNGAGKSTLIKLLSGAEPLTSGDYRLGHNVASRLFRAGSVQRAGSRRADARRSRERRAAPDQTELRNAARMLSLFAKTTSSSESACLSGGERNRYALAKMLLPPSNFLLLDEPTNHLDMRAKDVLLEALAEFTGTVVFVSHDRYFIDKLATRVFEIEDGEVHVFPGNYEDYLWRKSGKPLDILQMPVEASVKGTAAFPEQRRTSKKNASIR